MVRPLHGLRGIAALSVVIGHTAPVMFNPSLGVVLFFCLSGYLLARLYAGTAFTFNNVQSYAVARFARVSPLFAVVVLATAAINKATGSNVFDLGLTNIIPHLTLGGAGPTIWTISVEFQFYAIFIILWALRMHGWSRPLLLLCALGATGVFAFVIPLEGRINILRYLFIFLAGTMIAQVQIREALASVGLPLLAIAYVAIGIADPIGPIYDNPLAVAACVGLLACAVNAPASFASKILSLKTPYWLGEVSFGIYLLHRHAQRVAGKLLEDDWLRFGLIVVLTLTLAGLAHVAVERPSRDYLRKALQLRRNSTAGGQVR